MAADALHVVVFPFPVPGHYLPISSFARSLASCSVDGTDADVRVTLILTEANARKWQKQRRGLSDGDDHVHVVAVSDGLPLDFDRSANHHKFFPSVLQMGPTIQQCLQELQASCPISCLVSDPYFPWVQDVANHFSLPLFLFITDSGTVLSALLHTKRLLRDGLIGHGSADKADVVVDDIPGMPALPARALPFPRPELHEFFNMRLGIVNLIVSAAGLLLNTFYELEEEAVSFASRHLSKPVLAVGPCLPDVQVESNMVSGEDQGLAAAGGIRRSCQGSGAEEEEELMQWLDAHAPASVMYVSFGSLVGLSDVQIHEVWEGLKASKQPFLWATRSKLAKTLAEATGSGKDELEEQHQQRRRVAEWVPQQRVLNHPAVGGFMTHCGWNGALEGLSAGVPMLCCPQVLDQMLTSALIVRQWRLGVQLVESEHEPLERAAVERHVRLILVEEEGTPLRQRARHLRQAAMAAIRRSSPPGSSTLALYSLIKQLSLGQQVTSNPITEAR